eukprot:TRINITY_DN3699_c0_g1_i1.p1 TRINITY_DN3699_c0_g1~~TRINITY_DN3699_c0_g1_i1.p1  ORF type:complete len:430 (-),score=85.52 TRINITY_DN3699_c0_g1_i1:21-1310(-)
MKTSYTNSPVVNGKQFTNSRPSSPSPPVAQSSYAPFSSFWSFSKQSGSKPLSKSANGVPNNMGSDSYLNLSTSSSGTSTPTDSPPTTINNNCKTKKFERLLEQPNIELSTVRELSWSGIPQQYRPIIWKILVGYLPTNKERRQAVLQRKRSEYKEGIKQYNSESSPSEERTVDDYNNIKQIKKDLHRPHSTLPLLQLKEVQDTEQRILYLWSSKHPASGYVQGMNDLVVCFWLVFLSEFLEGDFSEYNLKLASKEDLLAVEADTYWCFALLMNNIQDHYTANQPGIQRQINQFERLIYACKKNLFNHLKSNGVISNMYAYRWMNNLLTREIPVELVPRMWDTYFSEESNAWEEFHVFVSAGLLMRFGEEVERKKNLEGLVLFLQRLPTEDWSERDVEELLSEAYLLKSRYSKAHLNTSLEGMESEEVKS